MAHVTTSTIDPTLTEAAATEVFAGIDWGGSFHQICLIDEDGKVLRQQRVPHDAAGFDELDRLLTCHRARLRVAIERAEGLLVEHLHLLGVEIFCVSPKISARARERYRMAAAKSDAFDAFVLADTLRHEHRHWRPLTPPSPVLAELRAISRDRDRIVIAQQATENRLRAVLEAYHPAPLHLFSTLDRDITPRLHHRLPHPGAGRPGRDRADGGVLPPSRLLRPHRARGTRRAATPAPAVRRRGHSGRQGVLGEPVHRAAADAQRLICAPTTSVSTSSSNATPTPRSSPAFPASDPSWPPRLISEMGEDRHRFPAPGALLAEAGLSPVTRASGRTRQVRFRYAANRRMRHMIDWWMFIAIREDDWSRQRLRRRPARGQGKYRALRGLGAHAGPGSCGAAGPTTPATTPPTTPTRSRPPPDPRGSGTAAQRRHPQPRSRLAAGHPQGSALTTARTLPHFCMPDRPHPRPRLTAGVCVVHLLRASLRYVAYDHRKRLAGALKPRLMLSGETLGGCPPLVGAI